MATVALKMRMIVGAELFLLGLLLIIGAFIALACPGKVPRLKRDHIAISLWIGMGLLFAPTILNERWSGCIMYDTPMSANTPF